MSLTIKIDYKSYVDRLLQALRGLNIYHLLLFSLALHLLILGQPSDGFVFDEAHYVPAALETLKGLPANVEHTPLTKILVAVSIGLLGNWWFAWRIPIVVFSLVATFYVYKIAKNFMSERYSLAAAALLTFNVLFFVHGSISLLDMPAIALGLMGISRYLEKKYYRSAFDFGVSFLFKELGLFFLGTVFLYHLMTHFKIPLLEKKQIKIFNRSHAQAWGIFLAIFFLVSLGGLWAYDVGFKVYTNAWIAQTANVVIITDADGNPITTTTRLINQTMGEVTNPIEHLYWAWKYFTGLSPQIVTPDSELRQPWTWILPLGNWNHPPVYMQVSLSGPEGVIPIIRWAGQTSPLIDFALIPLAALALFYRRKSFNLLYLAWVVVAYVPWMLLGLFLQRMTFNYYFIYTVPALCIGIPFAYSQLPVSKLTKDYVLVLQVLLAFIYLMYAFPLPLRRLF